MLELPNRGWLPLGGIEIAPAQTSDFRLTHYPNFGRLDAGRLFSGGFALEPAGGHRRQGTSKIVAYGIGVTRRTLLSSQHNGPLGRESLEPSARGRG
jgi:hypothetical protein